MQVFRKNTPNRISLIRVRTAIELNSAQSWQASSEYHELHEPSMEFDANSLFDQLTTPRVPDAGELHEAVSRAVLRVLRHGDESLAVQHDRFGLFLTNEFAAVLQTHSKLLAEDDFAETLDRVIQSLIATEKLEIRGSRIRALYGHSLRGIIVGQLKWPEIPMFHATSRRHLDSILEHGLRPQGRTWVHLTSEIEYANRIFKNHSFDGHPVLLEVDASRLEDHDVTFRRPNSHVWLANFIPPVGIKVCEPNDRSEIDNQY